jgi:hypothetical protein
MKFKYNRKKTYLIIIRIVIIEILSEISSLI